jgi:hypothetical protein
MQPLLVVDLLQELRDQSSRFPQIPDIPAGTPARTSGFL